MRVLVDFVHGGVVPLLGPKTSVGDFHHGAFYYFLLAPAAALSNGDPVMVTAFLALLGIGAVALTWWLARAIAGPGAGTWAGAIAGLLLAVSPAAIDESTFIWNPNLIALSSAIALAGAWRAWTTGRPRWWLLAGIGFFAVLSLAAAWRARTPGTTRRSAWWAIALGAAGAVTQLHVLGVVFLIAVVALVLLELRRDRGVAAGLVGGFGIIVVLFLPLLVHELQTGFQETRLVLDYVRGGDEPLAGGPVSALGFTLLRITGWPLMGLVTDVPSLAAVLLAVVVGVSAFGIMRARGDERRGLAWLVGILAWSTVALAFAAPSLQRVVPGLPNDHYHAFVDPVVVIIVAVPLAGLLGASLRAWRATRRPGPALGGLAVAGGLAALVAVAVVRMPLARDPDRGWPAMRAAGERIAPGAAGRGLYVVGLPTFKLPDAATFPIARAGGQLVAAFAIGAGAANAGTEIVVVCDRLFEPVIGAACGGPAEDAMIGRIVESAGGGLVIGAVDRFDASPRTAISVYAP